MRRTCIPVHGQSRTRTPFPRLPSFTAPRATSLVAADMYWPKVTTGKRCGKGCNSLGRSKTAGVWQRFASTFRRSHSASSPSSSTHFSRFVSFFSSSAKGRGELRIYTSPSTLFPTHSNNGFSFHLALLYRELLLQVFYVCINL
jgi:hypothetical protein